MTDSGEPRAEVIGQILLMQSTVHALVGDTQRAEFICAGLTCVPGVSEVGLCVNGVLFATTPGFGTSMPSCRTCDQQHAHDEVIYDRQARSEQPRASCPSADEKGLGEIKIGTTFSDYGSLLFRISDHSVYQRYKPYIESLANLLALLIETERQAKAIEVARLNLEEQIRGRTAELAALNRHLVEQEHFISRIIETAPTMIYIYDINKKKTIFSNDRITAITGYTPKECIALGEQVFARLIHPDDIPANEAHRARLVEMPDGDIAIFEFRMCHKDGTYRNIRLWESVFSRDDGGRPKEIAGVALDITEQRESEAQRAALEEQFLASQRMDAVGRLAGGVAHDFNNLLTVINSSAEMGAGEVSRESPARSRFEEILKAGRRGARLTRQLLAFSRKQILKPAVLNINDVVNNMESMLKRLIGEDVSLVVTLADGLGYVEADAGQLEQVIMNLAVNARDAMPSGGVLTLSTSNITLNEVYMNGELTKENNTYVMLSVSDTGAGMDEETRCRVFEPFFTTKAPGRGTGLGLSTAYGIIKQSGGDIWVDSTLGKGTRFEVYLPRAAPTENEPLPRPSLSSTSILAGSETILVVEDEEAIRLLVEKMLSASGYKVLSASGGGEALLLTDRYEGKIDLILTDVVMPGTNGRDLARRLSDSHPGMRVLYMSGYTDDVISRHGILEENVHFIAKPFTPSELRAAVRDVLDELDDCCPQ
jgi:two-component system, cell cycle sensor histidine kinase and response regulator CckA